MIEKMKKLIDVKSIVTLALTFVFGVMASHDKISPEQFLTVYTVVISFYFGTQFQKKGGS